MEHLITQLKDKRDELKHTLMSQSEFLATYVHLDESTASLNMPDIWETGWY